MNEIDENIKKAYKDKNNVLDAYNKYLELKSANKSINEMTDEEIDKYTKVTRDKKFMSVLNSFPDEVVPSLTDILPRYNALLDKEVEKRREENISSSNNETINQIGEQDNAAPVQKEEPVDPTTSFVEGARALNEKISKTPIDMENNPVKEPEPLPEVETILPDQNMGIQQKNNLTMRKKLTPDKLNQVGYANIVLMSIIVIIIVAIICVFVFVD